jgi:hypothetical protein
MLEYSMEMNGDQNVHKRTSVNIWVYCSINTTMLIIDLIYFRIKIKYSHLNKRKIPKLGSFSFFLEIIHVNESSMERIY